MKKVIAIAVVILIVGFVWIMNIQEKLVVKLQPSETTLPDSIEREIPNLYIDEQKGPRPYSYIFDPKEYGTNNEVYVLIALGDIKMDINIDKDNNVVELIPLYYPKIYQEYIVWNSENFVDNSENSDYKFTMHKIKVDNASEYEYEFVLAEDPKAELEQRIEEPGNAGARYAGDLPKPMKKR